MAIPTEKKCPRCNEVKPADAFGVKTKRGRHYLSGCCKPCRSAHDKGRYAHNPEYREARRAYKRTPEYREARNVHRRARYANDDDYRAQQLDRAHARLALKSCRARRIHALLDHFANRQAWIDRIASIVMKRPDAKGLQWLSSRIDDVCAHYCEA